jgi:uncharacterized protein (DUF427 family)
MWNYPEPYEDCVEVEDYVSFYWDKVDAWYEEDEEVFIGPKDPYTRVDTRESSRHVKVVVNGETVAETDNPVMLLETGLPHRYYIPKSDVRMDWLKSTVVVMKSTYKGIASYYNAEIGGRTVEDLAWCYEEPTGESAKIAGRICFPQGKVEMYVDGVLQQKPKSRWDR